jgi:hypothetical protein
MGKLYFACILILLSVTSCKNHRIIYDGFEKSGLNPIWSTNRMVRSAFTTQTKVVRKGGQAARITLNPGDVFEPGTGHDKDTERDELCERERLMAVEGKTYQYEFSLYLPADFPIVPTRLVIAQWKQYCGGNAGCGNDSPVLALRFQSGKFFITSQKDTGRDTVFQTNEDIRNKWLDFRIKVKFSRSDNGEIEGWMNNEQIVNFKGITCYSSKNGYPGKSRFYFKTGLYRDVMPGQMTIYIDEYKRIGLSEASKIR